MDSWSFISWATVWISARKNPAKHNTYFFFVYTTHFCFLWDWSGILSLFSSYSQTTNIVNSSLVASLEVSCVLPSNGSRKPVFLGNRSKLEMLMPFPLYNIHRFASFFFITRYIEPAVLLGWRTTKKAQALPSDNEMSRFKSSGNLDSALLD